VFMAIAVWNKSVLIKLWVFNSIRLQFMTTI
jgi:hypothetical protein